ncbi:MAG: ComF family protein [Actinomycetota bacterium]
MLSSIVDLVAPRRCAGCGAGGLRLCPTCAAALSSHDPPLPAGLDRARSALRYEGAARGLILSLKLRGDRSAADPLVEALVALAQGRGVRAEVVTWVPGRRREQRVRGFDHAEVLARGLAGALGLPCSALLERVAERPDQASLGAAQRRSNLRGAFQARSAAGAVLLVDDLLTTGATASACAEALRASRASFVEAMTACHSERG